MTTDSSLLYTLSKEFEVYPILLTESYFGMDFFQIFANKLLNQRLVPTKMQFNGFKHSFSKIARHLLPIKKSTFPNQPGQQLNPDKKGVSG